MYSKTFTGLFPGIHINLVATLLLGSLNLFSRFPIETLVVFIVAMSITHTFLDFIPSIFLGAPEEDTILSILPGHQLLQQGKGYEAVVLTLYGSLTAIFLTLLITPLLIFTIPWLSQNLKILIPYILILVSIYIILREKRISLAFLVFSLSGILGYLTLQLPINQPLMPLLTGLFGSSALIISLKTKTQPKVQQITTLKTIRLTKSEFLRSISAAIITAPFLSFLPAIGSGQAATLGSELIKQTQKSFLFLNGTINTMMMSLSFVTLYAINKSRTGSAAAINDLIKSLSINTLVLILVVILISGILSFFLGLFLTKNFTKLINKINYKILTILTLAILISLTLIFSGFIGLIILVTSTCLGIFTILSGARRINMMSCLLVPTIIYYLI